MKSQESIQAEIDLLMEMKADAIMDALPTNGKVFSIDFIKKDGTPRHMCCRLGVKKHVKGTNPEATQARKETNESKKQITVYEINKKQYRTVALKTVTHFKCGEVELDFTK